MMRETLLVFKMRYEVDMNSFHGFGIFSIQCYSLYLRIMSKVSLKRRLSDEQLKEKKIISEFSRKDSREK